MGGISIDPKNAEHPVAHLYETQNIKEEVLQWHVTAACVGVWVLRACLPERVHVS